MTKMIKFVVLAFALTFTSNLFAETSYANYSTDFDDEIPAKVKRVTSKTRNKVSTYKRRGSRGLNKARRSIRGIASVTEVAQASNAPAPISNFGGNDAPANARPGQCFTKIIVPAKYSYQKERIVVSPESSTMRTIPAKYGYEERRVLVQEATERHVTIPATYKWVEEKIEVVGASEQLVKIPAQYKNVAKRIMVSPATTEWKKGDNSGGGGVSNEALCLVEKPAQYKTVYEKVEVAPARTETKVIPGQFKTVRKRIVDRPAQVKTVPVPAQYKTVKIRKMVEPPRTVSTPIAAKYDTITKKVMVQDSKTLWSEILCKTNATPQTISKVQQALTRAGHSTGGADGRLGPGTYRAIESFQRSRGLVVGGGLTMETIKALNLNI